MPKPKRDARYCAWVAEHGCLICGMPATIHHHRKFGSPRDDHRILPLCPRHHQIQFGKESIEYLGRSGFEARFSVDLEAAIGEFRERYLARG